MLVVCSAQHLGLQPCLFRTISILDKFKALAVVHREYVEMEMECLLVVAVIVNETMDVASFALSITSMNVFLSA